MLILYFNVSIHLFRMQKILHERMPEKSISIQLDPGTLQCSGKIRAAEEDCTSKEIVFGFIEWLPEW
jgi:hypothetical protein